MQDKDQEYENHIDTNNENNGNNIYPSGYKIIPIYLVINGFLQ